MTRIGIWLVFLLLAVTVSMPGPAEAQTGYSDDRYPHLFAPRTQRPRIISIPQRSRPAARTTQSSESVRPPSERGRSASTNPDGSPSEGTPAPVDPTTFVVVLGDNLAEWLAYGIENAFEDVPELGVADRTRISSGLARPDVYDWVKSIPDLLAREAKVDFIVMMIGSNDRQAIRVDRDTFEPRTDRWRELYVQRVDQAMQAMKARGVPVYWVGLPPLRGQRISADMAYLNDLYKERAAQNGISYIDVWNGFVDEQGQYTQFGPDFAGQIRRLRTADGVHFTAAGARKLALFLEQDLRRDLVGRISPANPEATPAQVPDAGQQGPQAALPGPMVPEIVRPAPRPLAGPVLPLAGNPAQIRMPPGGTPPEATPSSSSSSTLAGDRPASTLQGTAAAVLVRGETPSALPGRADDFSWPPASRVPGPAASETRVP